MVSRVGIPETAPQSPTSVLKTLICLNDSYVHEQLKIVLYILPDGIDYWSVFVIAQLPVIACLHQFPKEMAY